MLCESIQAWMRPSVVMLYLVFQSSGKGEAVVKGLVKGLISGPSPNVATKMLSPNQ